MNIEQANSIPLSVILAKLDRKPYSEKKNELWFYSPFRNEKTPSFKVNTKTNTWYDFGTGKGGDVIQLVRDHLENTGENSQVKDSLRWTRNMTGAVPSIRHVPVNDDCKEDHTLVFKNATPIKKLGLIKYAQSRGIPESLLKKHVEEVTILNNKTGNTFFALGIKNKSKGYEIRNPFFKGCVGKKNISFVRGTKPKPSGIHIFEGFMDYLTVITQREGKLFEDDTIILHSLNCLAKATPYIRNYGYQYCYTWMDNDEPGQKATAAWAEFCKTEENLIHVPMNEGYTPYKDVNAHHMYKLEL